jgi:uncharacterized membrane protein YidH (DUF202 family)
MTISELNSKYAVLVEHGLLTSQQWEEANRAAAFRKIDLEEILIKEYDIGREMLLRTLSQKLDLASVEFDERLPVPPQLFKKLDLKQLSGLNWFPVILDKETVIIAVNPQDDGIIPGDYRQAFPREATEFRVALKSDISWFIQDFLNNSSGDIIGSERTTMSYWRNTMAEWRTRLACYRLHLAKIRTLLSVLRWGLGLIILSETLKALNQNLFFSEHLFWVTMVAGYFFSVYSVFSYIRTSRLKTKPPRHHTMVEVTAAVLRFLEDLHLDDVHLSCVLKKTMFSRLGDFLPPYCTILEPKPPSKVRTHLARERNVLAAQRTLAACYRTILAHARTNLSFINTGIIFISLGLTFFKYFKLHFAYFSVLLITATGVAMTSAGLFGYFQTRKEHVALQRIVL